MAEQPAENGAMRLSKTGATTKRSDRLVLRDGWRLAATEPGAIETPAALDQCAAEWIAAQVPGTVAQALREAGRWDLDSVLDFDTKDWWYRCSFEGHSESRLLRFSGLATLAQVWLNGVCVLQSDNMFQEYVVDVGEHLRSSNELLICFRSLTTALAQRRPRPRWKTKLVEHQQLRWFRTTLLGRIPGWSPPIAPVGPWRGVSVEPNAIVDDITLRTSLDGEDGIIAFRCRVMAPGDVISATLLLDESRFSLQTVRQGDNADVTGELRVQGIATWWPHTHGAPALHTCKIEITVRDQSFLLDCGKIGFRTITVDQEGGAFELSVNGQPVFCRGACWTVNDIVSLCGTTTSLVDALTLARDAGMNMVRIGGTMVYEQEAFYTLCDELGILVWQDFMFANMDYPIEDEQFRTNIEAEATQQLQRWQPHPCIAVYCGNSEVEQQAAMLGMPQEAWRSELFSRVLPELCAHWHPGVPYVPSTPSGGVLPFHVGSGITHYYGVGAYMRPFMEVRQANVRFTPECLGFANVPETGTVNTLMDGQQPVTHDPRWKRRVPRDSGAGWDFEDIRDHYLKTLFGVDPVQMRCFDTTRYLALSRVASGETMARVFSEWRSGHSRCGGGLVWFFKDLWPGAGWGVIDSTGVPKACLYYLRRTWRPLVLVISDEGLDGLHLHVVNETATAWSGTLSLALYQNGRIVVAQTETPLESPPRSTTTLSCDRLLGAFYDLTYAYRFGPAKHDVVAATLLNPDGNIVSDAFYFPEAHQPASVPSAGISVEAEALDDGRYRLTLNTDVFLYAVHFDVKHFRPDDNYFHVPPGRSKTVVFKCTSDRPEKFKGYADALNIGDPVRIAVRT